MSASTTQNVVPAVPSTSTSVHFGAEPFETEHANTEFLRSQIPRWYVYAPVELRLALQASFERSLVSRQVLQPIQSRLKSVEAFCKPLLEEALYKAFKVRLDSKAYQLRSVTFDHSYFFTSSKAYRQTLLQAALHNFDAAHGKPGGFPQEATISPTDRTRERTSFFGVVTAFGVNHQGPVDIKPEAFAGLCHTLDLGLRYEEHLNSVFKPSSAAQARHVAAAFMSSERDAFDTLAHLAMMKAHITAAAYSMLLEMATVGATPRWSGQGVRYRQLHMLDTYAFSGSILYGALLIQLDIANADASSCVVYLPAEPDHPIREYTSLAHFGEALTLKLVDKDYQAYLRRFVRLDKSELFFKKLNERLAGVTASGDASNVELYIQTHAVFVPPFESLYVHLKSKTYDDSRFIAVPSGVLDAEARRARLETLEGYGMDLLMVASFFIPVLGQVMAVAAIAQLAHEVFVSTQDWSHGETREALAHLFNAGESLAIGVSLGAAVVAAKRMVPSGFIESLAQGVLEAGKQRLWKPTLDVFARDVALPYGAKANTMGLINADGQTWLPLEGQLYKVQLDTSLQKWRVIHPRETARYSPILEHNNAGIWRHEWESPMGWEESKAFKRLSADHETFSEDAVQQVMDCTGADEAVLRQVHMEGLNAPALLMDASRRYSIAQQIETGIVGLKGDEPECVISSSIEPWLKLLASSPRWPWGRGLFLLDAETGATRNAWNAFADMKLSSRIAPTHRLTQALEAVLETLTPEELHDLVLKDALPKAQQLTVLCQHLGQLAEADKGTLFNDFYRLHNRSSDPQVELIRRDFPSLPDAVAEELIATASKSQKARMATDQRIPLAIAEQARECIHQLRLNRAIEGFYLEAANNPDVSTVAFGLLEHLPGWPQDLALDVLNDSVSAERIARLGNSQTATAHHLIVKTKTGYQSFTHQGDQLGNADQSFFGALLHALPYRTRATIGLAQGAEEQQLRGLLGARALGHREEVATLLKLQAIKPGFKWPQRLPDGRSGYPMSGRLCALLRRLGPRALHYSPQTTVKSLFPNLPDHEINQFLDALAGRHSGPRAQMPLFIQTQLEGLQVQLHTLDSTLRNWVSAAGESPSRIDVRRVVSQRMVACWRRLTARFRSRNGEPMGYILDLDFLTVEELPEISADFDHVVALKANRMDLAADNASAFLKRFKNLQSLGLQGNRLEVLPEAIGRLSQLEELSLSRNPLTLTADSLALLSSLTRLHTLDLSYCRLGTEPLLPAIHGLKNLNLRSTGIRAMPEWIWQVPELVRLDLRDNMIIDVSAVDLLNFNRLPNRTRMSIQLEGNPFSEQTLQRARTLLGGGSSRRMGFEGPRPRTNTLASPVAWLTGLEQSELELRNHQWHDVHAEPGSGEFFNVLDGLISSADYAASRHQLTRRVWNMISAVSSNAQLRQQIFSLAAHPQTCGDGLTLIFDDMEVHVLVFNVMESSLSAEQPNAMFKLVRGLDRIDQVEKIAQEHIDIYTESAGHQDPVEVRLAYRIGLARGLGLPQQATKMLFPGLAAVDASALDVAYRRIIARERTDEFLDALLTREFWANYLEEYDAKGFDALKTDFFERLESVDIDVSAGEQHYRERIELIARERKEAIQAHAKELSGRFAEVLAREETGPGSRRQP